MREQKPDGFGQKLNQVTKRGVRVAGSLMLFFAAPVFGSSLGVFTWALIEALNKIGPHTHSNSDNWPIFQVNGQWPFELWTWSPGTLLITFPATLPMNVYCLLTKNRLSSFALLVGVPEFLLASLWMNYLIDRDSLYVS